MKIGLLILEILCATGMVAVIAWPAGALLSLLVTLAAGFLAVLIAAGVQSHQLRGRHRRTKWTATVGFSNLYRRCPSWTKK